MTEPREWPNQCANVRDDLAELLKFEIVKLEKITTNQVNDEESMESLVAEVIHDLNLMHRSLERVGAATDPIIELNQKASQIKFAYQGA